MIIVTRAAVRSHDGDRAHQRILRKLMLYEPPVFRINLYRVRTCNQIGKARHQEQKKFSLLVESVACESHTTTLYAIIISYPNVFGRLPYGSGLASPITLKASQNPPIAPMPFST